MRRLYLVHVGEEGEGNNNNNGVVVERRWPRCYLVFLKPINAYLPNPEEGDTFVLYGSQRQSSRAGILFFVRKR